jgi:3-oxoadipate enol-lactonase
MKLHRVEEGDGPTLLLLGSLGSDVSLWEPLLPRLTAFRVVRVDLPGHGGSPVPDERVTIRGVAEAVLGLVDGSISVCGLSLGGLVATSLAAAAPARVERLVLACTKASFPPRAQWAERAALVRRDGMAAVADATLRRWFTSAAEPAVVERAEAMLVSTPAEGYARCCEALRDADLAPELPRIEAPTLVIAGTDDPTVTPGDAAALARAIPGARRATIERGAHLASAERPAEFAQALLGHLS